MYSYIVPIEDIWVLRISFLLPNFTKIGIFSLSFCSFEKNSRHATIWGAAAIAYPATSSSCGLWSRGQLYSVPAILIHQITTFIYLSADVLATDVAVFGTVSVQC